MHARRSVERPASRRPAPQAPARTPGTGVGAGDATGGGTGGDPGYRLSRRGLLAGGAAAALLAGCASPFSMIEAENGFPPIGEFVDVGGLRMHLWRTTPQDPAAAARIPAVLIHGASGNLRDFTFSIAQRIAERRPVIAVDRPGFGYSDRPEDGWQLRTQARLIREAVARVGVERSLVVGHSFGAAVTMAWAADAPETVAGIVPVSGVTIPYGGVGRVFSALGLTGVVTWAYTEYLKSIAEEGGIERFLARVFRPQPVPVGYAGYVGAPLALRQSTLDANRDDLQYVNGELRGLAPRYPAIQVPAEIIHGTADFIDVDRQSAVLATRLPRARLTLLPGVGHMAHHVGADMLVAALERLDPPAPPPADAPPADPVDPA
ncbi:MAG: alpha/beta hydrolase [Pseudomonadota bacterium]